MNRARPWLWIALFVGALALWPATAEAQDIEVTDDQVNQIAKQLYCPVCENVPLDVCPTRACEQWRETIRQMLAEGRSEEEIKQHFVEQYGARVLATPPPTGLNWLVYVIPPLAFLGGAAILWRALRSWRRAAPAPVSETPAEPPSDPYIARVEEELRRRG
ncbi:MAG: cytochrome c-type biogenesis protein [Chloroflexota bacterium]